MSLLHPFKDNIKYLTDTGRAQTLVYTGTTQRASTSGFSRTTKKLKNYFDIYCTENVVFAAINVTAYNTVMVGYNIESDIPEAKSSIEMLCKEADLKTALLEACTHVLIFGDAFLEKRRRKDGTVSHLFTVDPQTMTILYDQYGRITGYQQEITGTKGPLLKPEDILHFRFFPIPSSPYGLSLIEPNLSAIERKRATDQAIGNVMPRHGLKKLLVKVGNKEDGQIPPPEVMDAIRDKLEDLTEINEIVVPWVIDVSTIDEGGIQGIEEYYNYFLAQVVTGLMCPEEALGLGKGTTEATARTKAILWERMLKAYQHTFSEVLRQDLFNEHLLLKGFKQQNSEEPIFADIKFESVTEEDEALRAKWLGNLLRGFPGGKIPFTRNEIRHLMGFEPRKDMEDVVDNVSPPEATAPPQEQTPPPTPETATPSGGNNGRTVPVEPQKP
jgi:hypothetical protein